MSKNNSRQGEVFTFFRVRPGGRKGWQVVSRDYDTHQGVFIAEMAYRQAACNMAQRLDDHVMELCAEGFVDGQKAAHMAIATDALLHLKRLYGDTASEAELIARADSGMEG
jgi:hypothetical protein